MAVKDSKFSRRTIALFSLARENLKSAERELLAEKINSEIEKIRRLDNTAKVKKNISNSKQEIKNGNERK